MKQLIQPWTSCGRGKSRLRQPLIKRSRKRSRCCRELGEAEFRSQELQNGDSNFRCETNPSNRRKEINHRLPKPRSWPDMQSTVFVSSTPALLQPLTPEVANRMSQSILQLLQLLNPE